MPLGTEDPKSDLNTLNTLPLATDGKLVLATKGKGLVAVTAADGSVKTFETISRIDTPVEVGYYRNGGILPTVLRKMLRS